MSAEENKAALERYLHEAKILIVDGNFTYRVALKQTLLSFGALAENLFMAKTLKEGRELAEKIKPQMIFSDFLLSDGLGTHLIDQKKESIFILVSSTVNSAVVANAAELDVDQFLFKPYSQLHLKELLDGVIQKISEPSEAMKCLEDGKALLSLGEFEKASVLFERAKNDQKVYARACSYLAEIKKIKNDLESAIKSFRDGLSSTEVHFRCLMGLFRVLIQSNRIEEAYLVLKDILAYFPECPDRLAQALVLSVQTKNFVDIEEMFEVFNFMHVKPEKLLKHMSSALLVNGHYHLMHKNNSAALESFVRGASLMKEQKEFSHYIREKLTGYGLTNQIDEVLKRAGEKTAA